MKDIAAFKVQRTGEGLISLILPIEKSLFVLGELVDFLDLRDKGEFSIYEIIDMTLLDEDRVLHSLRVKINSEGCFVPLRLINLSWE